MILVMFAEDLVLNQVHLHSIGIAQPRQSTAEHYSIKTREPSLYIFFEFTDKLLHGVSPFVYCGFGTSNNVHLRRSASTVCGLPLCGAGWQPAADWQSACRQPSVNLHGPVEKRLRRFAACRYAGQVGNLRPIVNRPAAGIFWAQAEAPAPFAALRPSGHGVQPLR